MIDLHSLFKKPVTWIVLVCAILLFSGTKWLLSSSIHANERSLRNKGSIIQQQINEQEREAWKFIEDLGGENDSLLFRVIISNLDEDQELRDALGNDRTLLQVIKQKGREISYLKQKLSDVRLQHKKIL